MLVSFFVFCVTSLAVPVLAFAQSGSPAPEAPDSPGIGFIESYINGIDPSAMATQLAPLLLALGALFIALSGLALIMQFKNVAKSLMLSGVCCAVAGSAPGLLASLIASMKSLPVWLVLILAVFLSLSLLGTFASLFIGKAAAASMVGNLAAWVVRRVLLLLILPFTALRKIFSRDDL